MLIEPTPTTLQTYYCHHCHGMIATTDLTLINPVNASHCPFCDQETLNLITQEDYENNSDPSFFPPSQKLLLETFFKYSDNTFELLNAFKVITAFEVFTFQLKSFQGFEYVHIYFSPQLEITLQVKNISDFSIEIKATEPNLDSLSSNVY